MDTPSLKAPANGAQASQIVLSAKALPFFGPPSVNSLRGHVRITSGVTSRTFREPSHDRDADVARRQDTARSSVVIGDDEQTAGYTAKGGKAELISVAAKSTALWTGMELTGGKAAKSAGGALHNSGTVTLQSVVVTKNKSRSGGGLTNAKGATLTLSNSTVSDNSSTSGANSAPGGSGARISNAGVLVISGSTVSGNASGSGRLREHGPGRRRR